jgi:glycosyltransferase involved in cell wall biosynthesis
MKLLFIRLETIYPSKNGKVFSSSPFEKFILNSIKYKKDYKYIIPVSGDEKIPAISLNADKHILRLKNSVGIFKSLMQIPQIIRYLNIYKDYIIVARAPEQINFILFFIYRILSRKFIVWVVHDRDLLIKKIWADHGILSIFQILANYLFGKIEKMFISNNPSLINGQNLEKKLTTKQSFSTSIYSTLLTEDDVEKLNCISKNEEIYDKNKIKICYVGAVRKEKNIEKIMDLVCLLKDFSNKEVELNIFGDYKDYGLHRLRKIMSKKGILNNTKIHGFKKHNDLWNEISKNHFLVLLSDAEGTPRIVPESLALGVPVIISKNANVNSIITNKEGICMKDNLSNYSEISKIYEDRIAYLELSRNCILKSKNYNIEKIFIALEELSS